MTNPTSIPAPTRAPRGVGVVWLCERTAAHRLCDPILKRVLVVAAQPQRPQLGRIAVRCQLLPACREANPYVLFCVEIPHEIGRGITDTPVEASSPVAQVSSPVRCSQLIS